MKKYGHFVKITSFCLSCIILLSICSVNSIVSYATGISDSNSVNESDRYVTNEVSIKEQNDIKQYKMGIQEFVEPILGDQPISSCEYMYNLDGSADYICVEFDGGGYAIFAKETMEMMEYNPIGNLPYSNTTASKYYAGPASYLYKSGNNEFVNAVSGEKTVVSNVEIASASEKIREKITTPSDSKYEIDLSDFSSKEESTLSQENTRSSSAPPLDSNNWISAFTTSGVLISNYNYFLVGPLIGYYYSNTCGPIASQLILGYHNYYNDRRIIEDRYLNGYDDETNTVISPSLNPNYCYDPMYMSPSTLGTRSSSSGPNSFYLEMISRVKNEKDNTTYMDEMRDGLAAYLNERITSSGYTIDYTFTGTVALNYVNVQSLFNKNIPLILRIDDDFNNVSGFNHFVVGYGYQNYTYPSGEGTYGGYVVHLGNYASNQECIWINSLWCNGYISLEINHEHYYTEMSPIGTTGRTRYRCNGCGHYTDAAVHMSSLEQYKEGTWTLPTNMSRHKELYLTFTYGGNKLFQTFGNLDTVMRLYDADYNLLAYDDDDGKGTCSLFSYTVEAGKPYILKIELYGSTSSGEVKYGITPSTFTYSRFEDIENRSGTTALYHTATYLNQTQVFTFTPMQGGEYTFALNEIGSDPLDSYLYVIDPYSTSACLQDDDSGGNGDALVAANLTLGRTYFIVVTMYRFYYVSGALALSINLVT